MGNLLLEDAYFDLDTSYQLVLEKGNNKISKSLTGINAGKPTIFYDEDPFWVDLDTVKNFIELQMIESLNKLYPDNIKMYFESINLDGATYEYTFAKMCFQQPVFVTYSGGITQ